jgi:hypothetical protein
MMPALTWWKKKGQMNKELIKKELGEWKEGFKLKEKVSIHQKYTTKGGKSRYEIFFKKKKG